MSAPTDDDLVVTAARYALLPAIKAFFDRQGHEPDQVAKLAAAFEHALAYELTKRIASGTAR